MSNPFTIASCPPPAHRSPKFYIDDTLVVFQVESELYKISSYFLVRESVAFRDMFSLPRFENCEWSLEGTDDAYPIRLEGTTRQEFDSLLEFLHHGIHGDYNPSIEDWHAILSIADRYAFDKVRARALREVEARRSSIDPIERIVLSRKFNFPDWLRPTYTELVCASIALTHDEADKLGLHVTLMIMRARATWLSEKSIGQYYRRNVAQIVAEEVGCMELAGK